MYEIYSNVEDPDGFYGVKTHDVRSALLRQLEHEGDHRRLFGLHGASLESAQVGPTALSMVNVIQDLHSMGLYQIANEVLKSGQSRGTEITASAEPFTLDLAWQTSEWDLPLEADAACSSQGLLYSALRTVHRERDIEAARGVVLDATRAELGRLHGLGMERTAHIKATTENLLCLRELAHWLSPQLQKVLEEGTFQSDVLRPFTEIRRSLEYVCLALQDLVDLEVDFAKQSACCPFDSHFSELRALEKAKTHWAISPIRNSTVSRQYRRLVILN